jgi:replication factor C small subunit
MSLIDGIVKEEKLSVTQDAKKALITVADGDCRKATNLLQSCAAIEKTITPEIVYSLASVAEPAEIKEVLTTALKGDFIKAREKLLEVMLRYGLSGLDTIKQIQSEIWNLELDGRKKVNLIDKCGETEFRLVEGADEFVQLEALLAQFVLAGT